MISNLPHEKFQDIQIVEYHCIFDLVEGGTISQSLPTFVLSPLIPLSPLYASEINLYTTSPTASHFRIVSYNHLEYSFSKSKSPLFRTQITSPSSCKPSVCPYHFSHFLTSIISTSFMTVYIVFYYSSLCMYIIFH